MRDQLQVWFGRVTKALTVAAWTFAVSAGPWTEGSAVTEIRLHLDEAARESLGGIRVRTWSPPWN